MAVSACGAVEDGAIDDADRAATGLPAPSILRVDAPTLNAEQLRRHEEVQRFLADRYRDSGWRIVETTQTYAGDIIDWLDPSSVPGSQIAQPPKPSREEMQLPPGASLALSELDIYPELRGPQDTIPVHRPDFARYVHGDVEATNVDDYISKHLVSGMPAGQNRLYAGYAKMAANTTATSVINAFGGTIESGTLTLLEMAVVTRGSNPATTHEQVGVALSRDKANYADSQLRLMVEFFTAGDRVTGHFVGGWDGFMLGFVAAAGRPYGPGAVFTPSTIGGAQYEHTVKIQNFNGDWWVSHNGNWLGYYPGWLFNLINVSAAEALWYGEVYDPTPTTWTWTDMGSGLFASTAYGNAAYFRNPSYVAPSGVTYWAEGLAGLLPYAAACYTKSGLFSAAAPWNRYFYVGGPGGEAVGCD